MKHAPLLALALALAAPSVRAEGEASNVAAEALFGEGRALFKSGDFAGACAKFAESNRLDPAVGTEFNLADCEEHLGHLATAWAHWRHVVDVLAARPEDVRLPIARDHVATLATRLPRLKIVLAPGAPADTEVTLDGLALAPAALGADLPADPGNHTLLVGAPGRRDATVDVVLGEGETRSVTAAPGEPPPPLPAPAPSVENREKAGAPDRRLIGGVVGGAGLIGVGVGAVFGVLAASRWSDAQSLCPSPARCPSTAEQKVNEARSDGNVATVAFVAGGLAVATGAVLWLTAPRGTRVGLIAPPGAWAGVGLAGSFE
jgi:hypothetical protein